MKPSFLVGAIGVALSGLLGYHFIYARSQGQASVIQAQITEQQANQKAQAEVGALLRDVERYRKRLPAEPEPSWLVRETVALARNVGLELASISPESPQVGPQVTRLVIAVQFDATYHELGAFLDQIERSGHFLRIENIRLGGPTARAPERTTVSMSLSTLYLPPAAKLIAAPPTP